MDSRKQSIYDFFREQKINLSKNVKHMSFSNGVLKLTYPSGFTFTLREEDFPNRNLIACYEKVNGKYVITHYERDPEPISHIPTKSLFSEMSQLSGGIPA